MNSKRKKIYILCVITAAIMTAVISLYMYFNAVPEQPVIESTTVSEQIITVRWEKVRHAKSYKLYDLNSETPRLIKETDKNVIEFSGKWDDEYKLSLIAYNGEKASKPSTIKKVVIERPTPDYDSYETYVFFGSDSRATGDSWINDKSTGTEGTPMSDVIMLLKVNQISKTVDLISVYRDTLLDVSGKGTEFNKANIAYAYGGPSRAVEVLEQNLDIKIRGYVVANFKRVADAIDSLGGVPMSIENDEVQNVYKSDKYHRVPDVVNTCIDEMNNLYGTSSPHVSAGNDQILNGIQAVAYSRVRYTVGSDKQRTVRQRYVLKQMADAYRKADDKTRLKVVDTIISSVDTDIDFKDLFKLYSDYTIGKTIGFPAYKKDAIFINPLKERKWAVVPADLQKSVTALHNDIYNEPWYKPNKTVRKYSKTITKMMFYNGIGKKLKIDYNNRQTSLDNQY